ncbi:ferredoxin [Loktanella agnita]|uniref:ferredoxin n=1 Tax=Loktanella agnita TaxID=287097 RepID=UPI00398A4DE5
MPLAEHLHQRGLRELGQCQDAGQVITLIGPDQPRFWSHFTASPEYVDGLPNPLDRWSVRVITPIAAAMDGEAIFPSDGPPYAPFYSWALATGRCWTSPVGFLVHDDAGLFVSFRAAIRHPGRGDAARSPSPCDICVTQPCQTACPVDALVDEYDVAVCKTYLRGAKGTGCMTHGCAARRACPVGQGRRKPQQAAFHMEAFL